MIDIKKIKEETGANIIILFDENGNIIDSTDSDYVKNFALMTEAVFSMCNDLLRDITSSDLKQLTGRSTENYFIANKLKSNSIILIVSNNLSRFGFLLKYMNSINNK